MKLAIGSDHVGLELKEKLFAHLEERGIEYHDFGPYTNERTDYPIYAEKVATAVASGEYDRGLLICGTGVGISLAANKVPGIRAVVCSEPYSALLSRQHNDTNILAMGSRVVGLNLAMMILDAWLDGEFEGGRHKKRVEMIDEIDKRHHQ